MPSFNKYELYKIQQDSIIHKSNKEDTLIRSIASRQHDQKRVVSNYSLAQKHVDINQTKNTTVDSTLTRPEFSIIFLKKSSLIDNFSSKITEEESKENKCYIVEKNHPQGLKPVFYCQTEVEKPIINQYSIKEVSNQNNDWLIIPLILGSILFSGVVILYRKYLGLFFEGLIYGNQSNRLINEKNTHTRRLSRVLDLIFIISFSVLLDQIIRKFNVYTPPQSFSFLIFTVSFVFLLLLKSYYWAVYKFVSVFSNQKKFISDLFDNSSLYTRCLGFFLLPLVFLISYSGNFLPIIFIYFSIFIVTISLISRYIRMIRLFIEGGFSIFYFILYLCALEIAPLLLVYKEVISLSSEGS